MQRASASLTPAPRTGIAASSNISTKAVSPKYASVFPPPVGNQEVHHLAIGVVSIRDRGEGHELERELERPPHERLALRPLPAAPSRGSRRGGTPTERRRHAQSVDVLRTRWSARQQVATVPHILLKRAIGSDGMRASPACRAAEVRPRDESISAAMRAEVDRNPPASSASLGRGSGWRRAARNSFAPAALTAWISWRGIHVLATRRRPSTSTSHVAEQV